MLVWEDDLRGREPLALPCWKDPSRGDEPDEEVDEPFRAWVREGVWFNVCRACDSMPLPLVVLL